MKSNSSYSNNLLELEMSLSSLPCPFTAVSGIVKSGRFPTEILQRAVENMQRLCQGITVHHWALVTLQQKLKKALEKVAFVTKVASRNWGITED